MLIAKFVPWNENTISSLLTKRVKFSTVFDFNDFNEFVYLHPTTHMNGDTIRQIIMELPDQCDFMSDFKKLIVDRNLSIPENFCSTVEEMIENRDFFNSMAETLAFRSVGIFCASQVDVFGDDSASLMFAHYAENLSGFCLIYESKETCHEIEYVFSNKIKTSSGNVDRLIDWHRGHFSVENMKDFRTKSKGWAHQQELRKFNKPSILEAEEVGLELKCIFYTSRFKHLKALKEIKNKLYPDILLEQITPSRSERNFETSDGLNITQFFQDQWNYSIKTRKEDSEQ